MVVFTPTAKRVTACSPTAVRPGYIPPTPIPLETQVANVNQNSQIVLEGIVKTWVAGSDANSILTIEVDRYLRGHGPKTVKISGYFWVCAPNFAFSPGSRAVFFVEGDPASPQPLQNRGWFAAQEAVVTSVKTLTGQEPIAPDGTYDVLWLILLALAVLGIITFVHQRRTQP